VIDIKNAAMTSRNLKLFIQEIKILAYNVAPKFLDEMMSLSSSPSCSRQEA
jgi:hypothetical protein